MGATALFHATIHAIDALVFNTCLVMDLSKIISRHKATSLLRVSLSLSLSLCLYILYLLVYKHTTYDVWEAVYWMGETHRSSTKPKIKFEFHKQDNRSHGHLHHSSESWEPNYAQAGDIDRQPTKQHTTENYLIVLKYNYIFIWSILVPDFRVVREPISKPSDNLCTNT